MRKIIATAAVATLAFAGLTVLSGQASAAPNDVTATYGCNSATFTNNTSETINVNYGTANSGDVTDVQIPAGKSATVMAKTKNFGWTATSPNGTELAMLEWPGVDLPGNCTEAAREEQAKLFTVTYSCNQATFTNNTGGQVVLQYGQQNSGDTNTETLGNGQVFVAKSTANNFGWLAQERDGRTINVQEGGIDLTAKCSSTTKPSTQPTKKSENKKAETKKNETKKPAKAKTNRGLAKTGV